MFVGIFLGSVLLGCTLAFVAALIFRTRFFFQDGSAGLTYESGCFLIFAYSSYILAAALGLSGIVSLLFCGLVRQGGGWAGGRAGPRGVGFPSPGTWIPGASSTGVGSQLPLFT